MRFSQWSVDATPLPYYNNDYRHHHCEKNATHPLDFSQRGRAAVKAIEKRSSFCREWLPKNTTPTERNSDGNFSTDVCPASPDFSQRGRAAVKAIEKRSSFCREWLPKNTTPTERNSDGNFSTDVCPVRRWRFRRL